MPHSDEPSALFFKNGHLKTSSQHAPQRLHSPRRRASELIVSCLRKFVLTKRRIFPWAWRARSFASVNLRERTRSARRCSNERCFVTMVFRTCCITRIPLRLGRDLCGKPLAFRQIPEVNLRLCLEAAEPPSQLQYFLVQLNIFLRGC